MEKPTTGGLILFNTMFQKAASASDPNDPYARILELQDTIDTYHQANLSVIMGCSLQSRLPGR